MTTSISVDRLWQERRDMLGGLSGTVVEIGAGGGRTVPELAASIDWIGTEPDRRLRARLAEAARARGFAPPLDASAEALPVATADADVVLSVLALCSVDDLDRALGEARRVLRPGGRLAFLEHVAAPDRTGLRRLQRLLSPLTQALDHRCHLARDPVAAADRAGFVPSRLDTYLVSGRVPGVAWPFVVYEGRVGDVGR